MSEVIADAEVKDAPDQTAAVHPQTESTSNAGAEVLPQTPDHEGSDGAGPGTPPLLFHQFSPELMERFMLTASTQEFQQMQQLLQSAMNTPTVQTRSLTDDSNRWQLIADFFFFLADS